MEPNTSISPAAWTSSPAAVGVDHGEPSSVHDEPSLLSPAFAPAGLLSSGSGSESSLYQQIPPSPANGSLSVHAHTASPSSSQSAMPSSCFPTAGSGMVGYDDLLFGNPEAMTADTPVPMLLGDLWPGDSSSSSMAAPVLPECPSPGFFGFASEYSAPWPSEEMSSSSSAGGLAPPQSSHNLVGFAQPSSEPLMDDEEVSPVVKPPMPPIEEEEDEEEEEEMEEIDVSSFLVSDPEEQLPNASWTATSPQMAGSGAAGGPTSASAAGITGGNTWPQAMLALAAASTSTMVSTTRENMACHSVVGAMMIPPSTQGAGASSSSFNGFAQPSSALSSVLAPLAPNLQGPLLPVKQEVMEMEYDDDAARRHPDFISLDDEEDDVLYQDAIFGSWGSNSSSPAPTSFAPAGIWRGSSNGSPGFGPGSWGGGGGSSSSPSIAPGSWGSSSSSSSLGFAPGSWGAGSSSSPSFATGNWGSSTGRPSFGPSSTWGGGSGGSPSFDGSMLCFNQSTSIDNNYDGSSSMQKTRGKMASIPGLPPLPKVSIRASTGNGDAGIVFTDPEMAIIAKDRKLQELLRTDAKRLKRILYNRAYSAVAKVRRVMHTKNLERMVVTLEERRKSLCEQLQSLEEGSAALRAQQMEMQMTIDELEQQTMLKDVIREGLRADIENLKHLKLN